MRNFSLSIIATSLLIIGCSSTHTVTMSVQEPAVVDLPSTMEKVGVINRNQPAEKSGVLETVDQVFSVKGPELDKMGAAATINGLLEEFSKNDRFDVLKQPEIKQTENTAYGVFPAPMTWEMIDQICRDHGLDGLFSLEYYDTDSAIDYSSQRVTIEGPGGLEIPALEHHATVQTTIKTGWRIYDNTGRNMIDEYVITETITTSGKGVNPVEAAKAVTGRKEAVQTVSGNIGREYAQSILPYWTRVSRDYYVKGSENFKIARRRAQTGNWDGAADLWLMEIDHQKPKIAGRAHYNMAIINEINGNLDEAIEWARIAYEDYGDKRALRYLRTLQDRQSRMERLRRQQY